MPVLIRLWELLVSSQMLFAWATVPIINLEHRNFCCPPVLTLSLPFLHSPPSYSRWCLIIWTCVIFALTPTTLLEHFYSRKGLKYISILPTNPLGWRADHCSEWDSGMFSSPVGRRPDDFTFGYSIVIKSSNVWPKGKTLSFKLHAWNIHSLQYLCQSIIFYTYMIDLSLRWHFV